MVARNDLRSISCIRPRFCLPRSGRPLPSGLWTTPRARARARLCRTGLWEIAYGRQRTRRIVQNMLQREGVMLSRLRTGGRQRQRMWRRKRRHEPMTFEHTGKKGFALHSPCTRSQGREHRRGRRMIIVLPVVVIAVVRIFALRRVRRARNGASRLGIDLALRIGITVLAILRLTATARARAFPARRTTCGRLVVARVRAFLALMASWTGAITLEFARAAKVARDGNFFRARRCGGLCLCGLLLLRGNRGGLGRGRRWVERCGVDGQDRTRGERGRWWQLLYKLFVQVVACIFLEHLCTEKKREVRGEIRKVR